MSMNPFPGPQPYRATDRHRFHGRQELSRKLLGSILAHRVVTVYGPSGSGKSSLMQASVIPQLIDEHQFRVVRVDSWPEESNAASWLLEAMIDGFKLGAAVREMNATASVLHAAQRVARKSARPFLIYLDQLEQLLFHNRDTADMDEFADVLQGLADLPIQGLQLVLSLREDYLGSLRDRIEGRTVLLDHGFRVSPMRVGELARAMCKVAATGEPPQTWGFEETRALVMQVRVDGQAARDEAEAQAAFAQIVCRAIFEQRAAGQTTSENLDVAKILDQYMETTLSSLGELSVQAQALLEQQLITPDGSRTLRTEKELLASVPAEALATILMKLETAAILRAEEHQGRRYFELGHDWLGKQLRARIERHLREAEELRRMSQFQQSLLERSSEKEQSLQAQVGELAKAQSRWRTITIVAVIAAIGLLALSFPVIRSYLNNDELEQQSKTVMEEVKAVDWSDPHGIEDKLVKLDHLLDIILKLENHQRRGVPLSYGFGLYKGTELLESLRNEYIEAIQIAFVLPIKTHLEAGLANAKPNTYLRDREVLRQYLLLAAPDRIIVSEDEIALGRAFGWRMAGNDDVSDYMLTWVDAQRSFLTMPNGYFVQVGGNHLWWYLQALHSNRLVPPPIDEQKVKNARAQFLRIPAAERHYDVLITSVNEVPRDDNEMAGVSALKYPPLLLPQIFADRPDVLKFVTSKRFAAERRYVEVDGAHTERGHAKVLLNMVRAKELLEQDRWILGLEKNAEPLDSAHMAMEYQRRHTQQWDEFLRDIDVKPPESFKEAIELHNALIRSPWPYLQILRYVDDHTQWRRTARELGFDEVSAVKIKNLQMIDGRQSIVPLTFASLLGFSKANARQLDALVTDTPLQAYINLLKESRREMESTPQPPKAADLIQLSETLSDKAKKTEALLQPLDEHAKTILRPWLMNPFRIAGTRLGSSR